MPRRRQNRASTLPTSMAVSSRPQHRYGTRAATAARREASFFDFYGLPRELRDMVYENPVLLDSVYVSRDEDEFDTKITWLKTSLLLVSRQFRNEYRETATQKQTLVCWDDAESGIDFTYLPEKAREEARVAELHFACEAPHEMWSFGSHGLWLAENLQQLHTIKINVYVERKVDLRLEKVKAAVRSLHQLPLLSSLEIHWVDGSDSKIHPLQRPSLLLYRCEPKDLKDKTLEWKTYLSEVDQSGELPVEFNGPSQVSANYPGEDAFPLRIVEVEWDISGDEHSEYEDVGSDCSNYSD